MLDCIVIICLTVLMTVFRAGVFGDAVSASDLEGRPVGVSVTRKPISDA